ncbi:hypothetical protein [Streptomyces sp. cg35]|uniref:hypothetical protein n=1 Tax=Streptomyces sp. cg35 TaxID=3421650 RepID=UPI003D174FEA
MTTETPEPIRKSELPCIPAPENEFFTWFPHPGGGGDLVPGQISRGVQIIRPVRYGDWQPVAPDSWAPEAPGGDATAQSALLSPTPSRVVRRDRYYAAIRAVETGMDHASVLAVAEEVMAVADIEHAAEADELRRLLAAENQRANDAINREEAAEQAAREAQATVWREAMAECDKAGGAFAERGATDEASAAFSLMETFLRKAGEAEYAATPCTGVPCEDGGEPCDTHERLMGHIEGDHELCDPECPTP